MENIDKTYSIELNFIDELNLSRNGMILEIKTEFDIIRLCLQEIEQLDKMYFPMLDRIVVMPLRKLLCEKNSVLLKVCPDFRMPPLVNFSTIVSDNQTVIRPPFVVEKIDKWLSVEQWLEQNISWFDREPNTMAKVLPKYLYNNIMKKMGGKKYSKMKSKFESLYLKKEVEYKGELTEVYCKVNPSDTHANAEIYSILDQIGYNKLSIYDFLKHMSDKRGAHIDVGHSLVVQLVNNIDSSGMTPAYYFAIQMIYAAKKQISELENYWSEMPELII